MVVIKKEKKYLRNYQAASPFFFQNSSEPVESNHPKRVTWIYHDSIHWKLCRRNKRIKYMTIVSYRRLWQSSLIVWVLFLLAMNQSCKNEQFMIHLLRPSLPPQNGSVTPHGVTNHRFGETTAVGRQTRSPTCFTFRRFQTSKTARNAFFGKPLSKHLQGRSPKPACCRLPTRMSPNQHMLSLLARLQHPHDLPKRETPGVTMIKE